MEVIVHEDDFLLEQEDEAAQITRLEYMLRGLGIKQAPIKISDLDYHFARRLLSCLILVQDLTALNFEQKEHLMSDFIDEIQSLLNRKDQTCEPKLILNLCKQWYGSQESHIEDEELNELKTQMQQYFSSINSWSVTQQDLQPIMQGCLQMCDALLDKTEVQILGHIQDFYQSNQLNRSIVHALFIETLNRFDKEFQQLDNDVKESLSLMDLFCFWRRACGHAVTLERKMYLATMGVDDVTSAVDKPTLAIIQISMLVPMIFWITMCFITNDKLDIASKVTNYVLYFAAIMMIIKNCARYWNNKKIDHPNLVPKYRFIKNCQNIYAQQNTLGVKY